MFWRGLRGYLPANIVQGLVGFGSIILFTRLLSAADFGRYALGFAVTALVHTAIFTWIEAAMARFWAAQPDDAARATHLATLWRTLFVSSLIYLPLAALILWLLPLEAPLKWAIAAGVLAAPARCAVRMVQERLRAEGDVSRSAGLDISVTLGGFLAGAGFALLGLGGAAPLAGVAVASLAALPFVLPRELGFARGGLMETARARRYAGYGLPIAASLILAVALASTDRFLLAAFLDEGAVGAYHAGYSLANRTLDVMFLWLGAAGGPALVMALERGGGEALKRAANEQASTFLLIALPAAAGLALVAAPLAEVLVGEGLRAQAAAITPLIALSALLSGMTTYYFHQAFTLGERTRLLFAVMALPAVANLALNLILIPRMGVMGAALSTAISFAVGLVASALLGRRALALPVPWDALGRAGAATAVMALAVWLVPAFGGFAELMLKAGVGVLAYAAAAFALDAGGLRTHGSRLFNRLRPRIA